MYNIFVYQHSLFSISYYVLQYLKYSIRTKFYFSAFTYTIHVKLLQYYDISPNCPVHTDTKVSVWRNIYDICLILYQSAQPCPYGHLSVCLKKSLWYMFNSLSIWTPLSVRTPKCLFVYWIYIVYYNISMFLQAALSIRTPKCLFEEIFMIYV